MEPAAPTTRLVDALQAADINRQSLALEVRAQLVNLGALPDALTEQLTDLVEKRGTVRSFCKAVQCQCDEQGIPVLERAAYALLNEQIPSSIASTADEARAQQRTAQRRRASGEELEDDSRFSR